MIKYCKKCLTPNSRPRIVFDLNDICNACHTAEEKNKIDWRAREDEFKELIYELKKLGCVYDCVVSWSGGKDSSSIAYKLKYEFGLNPLLVTASPLIPNELALHNRNEMLKLGFDNVLITPSVNVSTYLSKRFLVERGNPKVHWEASKEAIPLITALRYEIPLIMQAEHGDSEYGGLVLSEESKKIRNYTEIVEHIVGDDPTNWIDDFVTENDLFYYRYPDRKKIEELDLKVMYFSYFFRWSMYENYKYIRDKINFKTAPFQRTDGTFTNFDSLDDKIDTLYYYLQYIKFGFGRASRDASRLLNNGHITKEQAIEYIYKYDHEFPRVYLDDQLNYLGITIDELNSIVDKHRNPEIWYKDNNNLWKLKYPPY